MTSAAATAVGAATPRRTTASASAAATSTSAAAAPRGRVMLAAEMESVWSDRLEWELSTLKAAHSVELSAERASHATERDSLLELVTQDSMHLREENQQLRDQVAKLVKEALEKPAVVAVESPKSTSPQSGRSLRPSARETPAKAAKHSARTEELHAFIEEQKKKIAEWKQTLVTYKAWHDKVVKKYTQQIAHLTHEANKNRALAALTVIEERPRASKKTGAMVSASSSATALVPIAESPSSSSSSSALVHLSPSSTALVGAFPAPLTLESGATTKQHMNNLFAQVNALKNQLAGLNRSKPQSPALTSPQQERLTAASPVLQLTQSASKSVASIEANPIDHTKPCLSLNTMTQTMCTTSSIDGKSSSNAGELLSTLSQQYSTLSSSSTSIDDLMKVIAGQIATYHSTIHSLTAQVDHFVAKEKTSAEEIEALKLQLQERSNQLTEGRKSINTFNEQISTLQREFKLDGADSPAEFFATLNRFLAHLCAQQDELSQSLRTAEDANRTLHSLCEAEKEQGAKWHAEVISQRQMQNDLEALRIEMNECRMGEAKMALVAERAVLAAQAAATAVTPRKEAPIAVAPQATSPKKAPAAVILQPISRVATVPRRSLRVVVSEEPVAAPVATLVATPIAAPAAIPSPDQVCAPTHRRVDSDVASSDPTAAYHKWTNEFEQILSAIKVDDERRRCELKATRLANEARRTASRSAAPPAVAPPQARQPTYQAVPLPAVPSMSRPMLNWAATGYELLQPASSRVTTTTTTTNINSSTVTSTTVRGRDRTIAWTKPTPIPSKHTAFERVQPADATSAQPRMTCQHRRYNCPCPAFA